MNQVAGWTLLPPKKEVCQQCAADHDPGLPHNQESLYWKYWFYGQYGRWPTWKDAMAHCSQDVQDFWTVELEKLGVHVEKEPS